MNQPFVPPVLAATGAPPSGDRARVFISYSRKDIGFAQALAADLAARGFDAFLDKTDIAPGEPWQERLAGLIAATDTVVFVVSPASAASRICAWELDESARRGKRIIPMVARPVADGEAPPTLGRLNYIFCTDADDRVAALSELEQALNTDLPWVREHTRLGELARRWDERGRANWAALRGVDLDAAERWLDRHPADANAPTELHRAFIRASRRAATGRQRAWVGGALAVALVATGLAVFAEISRRDAQTQRAAAETAKTEAQRQRDAARAATREAKAQRDHAEAARREAEAQRKEAEAQRKAAELNFAAAKQAVDGLIFDIAQGLRDVAGMRVETIRSILETVRRTVDKLLVTAPHDRGLLRSRAAMLANFGDTYVAAGDQKDALAAYQDMLGILRGLAARAPDDAQLQRDLSVSLNNIGVVRKKEGDLAGALRAYEDSLSILRKLAARTPGEADIRRSLCDGLNNVARLKLQVGDAAGALKAALESLAIARALVAENRADVEALRALVVSLERVGDAKQEADDAGGAMAAFQESLEHAGSIALSEPDSTRAQRQLSTLLEKVGTAKLLLRDEAGAMADYRQSLDIGRKLVEQDQGNAEFERDLSLSFNKIGNLLLQVGDAKQALVYFQEGLDIRRKIADRDHGNAQAQRDLALSLEAIGDEKAADDRSGALVAYEESLKLRRAVLALDQNSAQAQWDLVVMLVKLGAVTADPTPLYTEALTICESLDRAGRLAQRHRFAIRDLQDRLAALTAKKQ